MKTFLSRLVRRVLCFFGQHYGVTYFGPYGNRECVFLKTCECGRHWYDASSFASSVIRWAPCVSDEEVAASIERERAQSHARSIR